MGTGKTRVSCMRRKMGNAAADTALPKSMDTSSQSRAQRKGA